MSSSDTSSNFVASKRRAASVHASTLIGVEYTSVANTLPSATPHKKCVASSPSRSAATALASRSNRPITSRIARRAMGKSSTITVGAPLSHIA